MPELFADSTSVKGNVIIAFKNEEEEARLFQFLREDGFGVYRCRTFEDFMEVDHVDLKCIIVEVTSGNDSVFHAIEIIKQSKEGIAIPMLVVADMASSDHVVRALNTGANDYVLFPYSRKEIMQSISAIIRRFAMYDINRK